MKKLSFALIIFAVVAATLSAKPKASKKMESTMTQEQLLDRMELRELVDRYAAESDKGNQEYYRNIFAKNLKLRIIAGENITEINGVDDMVRIYKSAGAAKISFHQTGEQVLDFADSTHARRALCISLRF